MDARRRLAVFEIVRGNQHVRRALRERLAFGHGCYAALTVAECLREVQFVRATFQPEMLFERIARDRTSDRTLLHDDIESHGLAVSRKREVAYGLFHFQPLMNCDLTVFRVAFMKPCPDHPALKLSHSVRHRSVRNNP
ncbi:hypothetical protein BN2476_500179 [Paraburkholderia piptadeniae]|uniref:Uncharacterized protein n=1 Tax=Paraburkholderia piptadeniae TaxID=1701573 RepID=A0A1N7SG32_9BURK|nr:hypothetical protein BN2476_500179 [Paraburkholderia piptadeniae]